MNVYRLFVASIGLFLLMGYMNATQAQHSIEQVSEDSKRHGAIALAHTEAAQCLADGSQTAQCLSALKSSCVGLGIGKYCGLKEDALPQAAVSLRQTAQAHQRMAQCIESSKPYEECLWDLQSSCKGLAIGKYCGMVHAHTF